MLARKRRFSAKAKPPNSPYQLLHVGCGRPFPMTTAGSPCDTAFPAARYAYPHGATECGVQRVDADLSTSSPLVSHSGRSRDRLPCNFGLTLG